MSDPGSYCIPSNPDISGIGVRTAIYAQNLLSFGPAIHALHDGWVTLAELDSLETQSTTILFTAFAILISAIIQAATSGLTNFHATIILNLSWMNNTNTFIYFLLYVHHKAMGARQDGLIGTAGWNEYWEWNTRALSRWINHGKKALCHPVLIFGSLHLSLMAAVGLWLWSQPGAFGISSPCSLSASVVVLGRRVPLASEGLRGWSIFIYALLLVPGFNLIIPIGFFTIPYLVYRHAARKSTRSSPSITPIALGLLVLAAIDIIFLVDTEVAIRNNKPIQQEGDSKWTFGQTLALLLLLVPLRDLSETFLQRHRKKLPDLLGGEVTLRLKDLLRHPQIDFDLVRRYIEQGADVNIKGVKCSISLKTY